MLGVTLLSTASFASAATSGLLPLFGSVAYSAVHLADAGSDGGLQPVRNGGETQSQRRAPPKQPVRIPLTRRYGEIYYGDTEVMRSHFVAQINLGKKTTGQTLDVVFDSSSGHIILPDVTCKTQACTQRTQYSLKKTGGKTMENVRYGMNGEDTFVSNVHAELDMVDFAIGSTESVFSNDGVCFSATMDYGGNMADTCVDMNLMSATSMSDTPFSQLPYDGIIGLGLKELSINSDFNFLHKWHAAAENNAEGQCDTQGFAYQFAFFFPPDREGPGELTIGGHVTSHLASPLVWVPVDKPEEGFWMIKLKAIRIGAKTLKDACPKGECYGLIDTSSSRLGVPAKVHSLFTQELALTTPSDGDCRKAAGQMLRLVLAETEDSLLSDGGDEELRLNSGDYGVLAFDKCTPELVPLRDTMPRENVYVLGESLLRRYYTVFDWERKRIGFGLASTDAKVDTKATPQEPTCKAKR